MTASEIRLLKLEITKYKKLYESQMIVTKKIADYWAAKGRELEEKSK